MELSKEQIDGMLQQALPSVVEGFKKELTQSITWQLKESAAKQVSEHVTKWVSSEVLPEVTKLLVESKDGLLSMGPLLGQSIVEAMAKSLTETLSTKLQSSWERKKVFEAMFGA